MKHACIKPGCTNSYEDNDPDAYYCPPCREVAKAIAATVDAQHQPSERVPSPLEQFEAMQQRHGRFVPLNELQ